MNVSTILHLNQTAVEYAFHIVKQTPKEQMLREITSRYRVNRQHALEDYQRLNDRIQAIITSPDVDPETFLDFERSKPHSQPASAPIRLDCALTYRLPATFDDSLAPNSRVVREMSTEEWCGIFDKAWSFGIPHIILTGGDPTLRNDLTELIAHTESNGQVVGLICDGLKLIDNNYLQALLQTGLDHIMITISPGNEISWKALENVLAADLFVSVHITLTPQIIDIVQSVLQRLANIGVKAISLTASDPGLQNSLIQSRNQAASLNMSLVWDLPVPYSAFNPIALETQMDNLPLGAGHTWLYIEPDGDVLPAQGINQLLGNVLSDPWEQLWK